MQYTAWNKISPFWPLQNLVACNPMWGFVDRSFDEVLVRDSVLFRNKNIPDNLEELNLHSVKYLKAFFDESQAVIKMPNKQMGLLNACLGLIVFDEKITKQKAEKITFIKSAPTNADDMINYCLDKLKVSADKVDLFLTILLTSLSGWSSFVQYKAEWEGNNKILQNDFLALRILIFTLISDEWQRVTESYDLQKDNYIADLDRIKEFEKKYRSELFSVLKIKDSTSDKPADAQFVFCIDVRSEPIRKALEEQGNYETFGFAGFFGIPVTVNNAVKETSYPSCPVLLKPNHNVHIDLNDNDKNIKKYTTVKKFKKYIKNLYSDFKYNFTTPLLLVDFLGLISCVKMLQKSLGLKYKSDLKIKDGVNIDLIPLGEQIGYARGFLASIGLVKNFAKLVILCGHGSQTNNNTFATALDCGACGGRHGGDSSRILANIMNNKQVRDILKQDYKIEIPEDTVFLAGLHNTTNDDIDLYENDAPVDINLTQINNDINKAKQINLKNRLIKLGKPTLDYLQIANKIIYDWSETRPEWGLAKNASFIVAPREQTKDINLDGRSFLHSYDYKIDSEGQIIKVILTAPMVVAHWINSQYLFSTIDNVAFGAGSKITHNITNKVAVTQGNESDIMHGLPLQSVFKDDLSPYHEPIRLTVVVYGKCSLISKAIQEADILQKLFKNGWVYMVCFDMEDKQKYELQTNLEWKPM